MKIKDYKCKCGHNDFFFADQGNQKGIYCSYCGKWLKWADKDEQNLRMKQASAFENIGDKEWVSILDRPPSKDGRYYVTRHDFVTQTDFTDILWYEKGVWWNKQAIGDYAVMAWQLLPEPYKAESEDKE